MKRTRALLLALATSAALHAQVFLTSFGFDDFTDYSAPGLVQTPGSGHFEADPLTASLSGDFSSGPIDVTGNTSALALTATVLEGPDLGFSIFLVDVDLNTFRYDGAWSDFVTGQSGTATLLAAPGQSGPFDFTQVIGLDFGFDSLSGDNLVVTFTALAAVPEPASFAALAGLGGLAAAVTRRRRR